MNHAQTRIVVANGVPFTVAFALLIGTLLATAAGSAPPPSPKRSVTDTYHGVAVTDDYRWLEDWNNPEVKKWSEAQNAHARAVLDGLPGVEALRTELTKIMAA